MNTVSFDTLSLSPETLKALAELGFENASPIQAQAIPVLLEGKDMMGQAQTGTGKTAAFALPLLEQINMEQRGIQAVVICPTRELALQVTEEFRKLGKYKQGLSVVSVYGGQPLERQKRALMKRPQILIGTPGRMLDFLRRGALRFDNVKTVVLDEADEMLNMGFRDDIETIFGFVPTPRQVVFFSATMPRAILELTRHYQTNPEWVRIEPQAVEVSQITQSYVEVLQKSKPQVLQQLIGQYALNLALVFCNTKSQVDNLVDHLVAEGLPAEGLHGGKTQNQRERILGRFRKGITGILVATDVAARGIDVRNIQAVVNYDLPEDGENYTHRIGRTGRAGQSGYAFSLVASHQVHYLRQIQRIQGDAMTRQVLDGMTPLDFSNLQGEVPSRGKRPFPSGRPPHRQGQGGRPGFKRSDSKQKHRA